MLSDDFDPPKPSNKPKVLDGMSVEELKSYVQALKAEISRAEAAIAAKEAHLAAAASLFKRPG